MLLIPNAAIRDNNPNTVILLVLFKPVAGKAFCLSLLPDGFSGVFGSGFPGVSGLLGF